MTRLNEAKLLELWEHGPKALADRLCSIAEAQEAATREECAAVCEAKALKCTGIPAEGRAARECATMIRALGKDGER